MSKARTKSRPARSKPETLVALPGPDVVTKAQTALVEKIKKECGKALPPNCGMTPDRFARIALTEIRPNPKLLLDEAALMGAILEAAQMGLQIGGALQRCWLVPYKGKAKLMMGFQGFAELAYRSGRVFSLDAEVVYLEDKFVLMDTQDGTHFEHVKNLRVDDRGEMYAVWARALLVNRAGQFIGSKTIVLSKVDVMRAKRSAHGIDSPDSPWKKHEPEMWKKVAVRNLSKLLPMLTSDAMFATAIDVDNTAYDPHAVVDLPMLPAAASAPKGVGSGVLGAKSLIMGDAGNVGSVEPAPAKIAAPKSPPEPGAPQSQAEAFVDGIQPAENPDASPPDTSTPPAEPAAPKTEETIGIPEDSDVEVGKCKCGAELKSTGMYTGECPDDTCQYYGMEVNV